MCVCVWSGINVTHNDTHTHCGATFNTTNSICGWKMRIESGKGSAKGNGNGNGYRNGHGNGTAGTGTSVRH